MLTSCTGKRSGKDIFVNGISKPPNMEMKMKSWLWTTDSDLGPSETKSTGSTGKTQDLKCTQWQCSTR
ncbi:hypothetical protein AOXY_G1850 [Acipenser oxyrinchus oxyrinchus]|uniref:Uncharacterized protein n=1 Tax=Acipenser oxyrinchus oxyrinchus TaxID=40147 RepID=A0AAD8GHR1_ACIOX|nr:hypothetical protein AOXY_G1850 [Acipenser oxyrinchus oxyrinchus]